MMTDENYIKAKNIVPMLYLYYSLFSCFLMKGEKDV